MPQARVISNTSPLFYLHQIGQIQLLPALFDEVLVPRAVFQELQVGRSKGLQVPDLENLDWVQIRDLPDASLLPAVIDLGRGEAEVIALGLTIPDSLLVLDDRLGRRIAAVSQLRFTGILGVLIQAKKAGHLASVLPALTSLRQTTMRMNDDLVDHVLAECGEL